MGRIDTLKRRMMKWQEYHVSPHQDIVDPGHKHCCYEGTANFAIIPLHHLPHWLTMAGRLRLLPYLSF